MSVALPQSKTRTGTIAKLLSPSATVRPLTCVVAIFIGAFLTGFFTRMVGVALPDLRGQFGLSVDEAAWLGTVLSASQLLVAPVVPWFAATLGPYRIVVPAAILLSVASFLAPFAHGYAAILTLHALCGIALGVFLSLTIWLSFKHLRPPFWMMVIAFYVVRLVFGTNMGVPVAGVLVEELGWQWVYWLPAIVSPVIAALIHRAIPAGAIDYAGLRRTDWAGMALVCIGLALVCIGVEQGERLDWFNSGLITTLLVGGTFLIVAAFVKARFTQGPRFPNFAGIAYHNVLIGFSLSFAYTMTIVANAALITGFLGSIASLKPIQTGWVFGWTLMACIASLPPIIWAARRIDTRVILVAGFLIFAAASILGTHLTHEWRMEEFRVLLMLFGVGNSCVFVGIMCVIIASTKPQNTIDMLGFVPFVRIVVPSVLAAAMTWWLRTRQAVHSAQLSETIQFGDPAAHGSVSTISGSGASGEALQELILREAQVLTYIDGWWLTFGACMVGLLLVALLRPSPPNPIVPPLMKM